MDAMRVLNHKLEEIAQRHPYQALYPFGLACCQRHASAHMACKLRSARQPSSDKAREASA